MTTTIQNLEMSLKLNNFRGKKMKSLFIKYIFLTMLFLIFGYRLATAGDENIVGFLENSKKFDSLDEHTKNRYELIKKKANLEAWPKKQKFVDLMNIKVGFKNSLPEDVVVMKINDYAMKNEKISFELYAHRHYIFINFENVQRTITAQEKLLTSLIKRGVDEVEVEPVGVEGAVYATKDNISRIAFYNIYAEIKYAKDRKASVSKENVEKIDEILSMSQKGFLRDLLIKLNEQTTN